MPHQVIQPQQMLAEVTQQIRMVQKQPDQVQPVQMYTIFTPEQFELDSFMTIPRVFVDVSSSL